MIQSATSRNDRKRGTDFLFVVDMSGSMTPLRRDVIRLLNEQLAEARRLTLHRTVRLSIVVFNDPTRIVERIWRGRPGEIRHFNRSAYTPDGSTALLDAACQSIDRLAAEKPPDSDVVVFFLTDGEENASLRFSLRDLASRTHRLQATGHWQFHYMGANQDLGWVSSELGLPRDHISTFECTALGVRDASLTMRTSMTSSLR